MSADYMPIAVGRTHLFDGEVGDGGFAFYTSIAALDAIETDGPTWKFADAHLVTQAIEDPVAIFGV